MLSYYKLFLTDALFTYFLTFFSSSSKWQLAFSFRMCTVLYVWFRDQLRSERMSPSLDSTFQLRGMKAACFKDTLCETTGAGLGFVVWSWQCCLCLAAASIGHSELAFLWFPHMQNCTGVYTLARKKKVPRFSKITENTSTRLLGILC